MKLAIEEKKLVMWIYCLTTLLSMCAIVDNISIRAITYNIKYLYVLFIILIYFYDGVIVWNRRMAIVSGALITHTILYGVVFTNPVIKESTTALFKDLMGTYMVAVFTCLYVYKKQCYAYFLEMTYLAMAIFNTWCAFTHVGNFVNPIYFINIFSRAERFRADFGMSDVNYCGNYCVYLLIISFCLSHEWYKKGKKVKKWIRLVKMGVDMMSLCMLLSTASRSGIISLSLFFICYFIFNRREWIIKNWKTVFSVGGIVLFIALTIIFSTDALSNMWSESNREGNYDINYPIFLEFGNYINGMGYMDNSGFLNKAYGFETTAMDVYYLYIPFATGILGSALIFGQMIYLLYQLIRHSKVEGRDLALSMFLMMLYYAIWQVNYMNCRYYTGVIHMVILFYFLMKIREEKDVYVFKFKRR